MTKIKCVDCDNNALEKFLNNIVVDHDINFVYALNQLRSMVIISEREQGLELNKSETHNMHKSNSKVNNKK